MVEQSKIIDFDALKLTLASPERILSWSQGEVTKPETVNYRTQKPEKDGLFCEKIFGPTKDWQCACGKYKKIRYKGIICDRCGVEITHSRVRRERMGHITLASPCSHIWFLRGVPSKIGLMLDLSVQNLEKVIYFANFIITKVDEDLKKQTLEQIRQEFKAKKKKIEVDYSRQINLVKSKLIKKKPDFKPSEIEELVEKEVVNLNDLKRGKIKELEQTLQLAGQELKDLKLLKIISEHTYQELSLRYGHIFEAGIGAEAIRKLLENIELDKLSTQLNEQLKTAHGPLREKIMKRLRLIRNLSKNKIRPEWMVLTVIPVIPPDLRPMVPLDGGRFATSDLNDLYRRIINRNNRLKQLLELNAPEVICRNERRMLQEAVDALIDNSARHGKTVTSGIQRRALKSLADILRGKQGRFRQNLLGKRIDYSGRSVIVVGPRLRIHQCGIPKTMALELFKPFIISQLIKRGHVHNVRSASRLIENGQPEVWDILEEIIKNSHVLLNRAPTLHRLGIQAFQPVLIEGKAIQVPPLVCAAFNADFDGDQMAVHLPLTEEAKKEAFEIMLSKNNLLKPATGEPIATPNRDMVWGCYYMTSIGGDQKEKTKIFATPKEALLAYQLDLIDLQDKILVKKESLGKILEDFKTSKINPLLVETSIGRILFNQLFPPDLPYFNKIVDNKTLKEIVSFCFEKYDITQVAQLLDDIKDLSLKYLTSSGYSWGMDDTPEIKKREEIITDGEKRVEEIESQYNAGLLTKSERYNKIIEIWMDIKEQISGLSKEALDPSGPIFSMLDSGARGSWGQLIQIIGMKGLVTNPAGQIIELPVKGNFQEGFDVLEYFISTHGARKGLSDTALRTSNAGYLTRRLVDVAQDIVIVENDCQDTTGLTITRQDSKEIGLNLIERIKGRFSLEKIVNPKTKRVIIDKGELITEEKTRQLDKLNLSEIKVRSVMSCKLKKGACQKCYGYDLAYNKLVGLGTAVGIIAAQSIGEPGTQLTLRTFHTGGVAGLDITQGLPRVEEIFEIRSPKNKAIIAEVDGRLNFEEINKSGEGASKYKVIKVLYLDREKDYYPLKTSSSKKNKKIEIKIKDNTLVKQGDLLFINEFGEKVIAKRQGKVKLEKDQMIVFTEINKEREYQVSPEFRLVVSDGDWVRKGDQLTDGSLDLRQLYRLKSKEETQRYIVKEIQAIYSSHGQRLNDKHIELIVRQMFSRALIKKPGDSDFLPGERVTFSEFEEVNEQIKKQGGKPVEGERLILGITKVSLSTPSFLSAASFQETARVLINAAVEGRIDKLEGLKENVIIGRVIPAGTGFRKE